MSKDGHKDFKQPPQPAKIGASDVVWAVPAPADADVLAARRDIARRLDELRPTFIALGDETRQLVLYTLLKGARDGMRVGEIQELTYLSRPTVTHHLEVLMEAGIVARRQEGRMSFYYLRSDHEVWDAIEQLAVVVRDIARERKVLAEDDNKIS